MLEAKEIISLMSSPSKKDVEIIERAHNFAQKAHEKQKRYSGEDFFSHLHETAKNLATYKMRGEAIAAGLLHDSIEDGAATEEEIQKEFGDEILFLIKGVTKLGKLKYKGTKRHVESLRRLFLATSEDIRVLMIKLTDRLHNMQTLEYVPKEKQKRIAMETSEIYAPLAYRLGMNKLNRELEDLAFKYLKPDAYEKIDQIIKRRTKKDIEYLEKITNSLKKSMAKEKIKVINTHFRVKGVRSLYKKLKKRDDEDSVYDILALRIIVPAVEDCYKTLGIAHRLWKPAPGRIKDYIALPKTNGYRSLQTTVFTGDGSLVEIQIRTEEMHREAEYGIAAHAKYKGQNKGILSWINIFGNATGKITEGMKAPQWVKNINNNSQENFIKDIKQDVLGQRIFVLTPNGDAIDLPEDSSPIDFAYAIHSDIGDYLSGVKINGKMSSLEKALKNGDIIEIMTKKTLSPTSKWLKLVKTNVAKRHIRGILEKEK